MSIADEVSNGPMVLAALNMVKRQIDWASQLRYRRHRNPLAELTGTTAGTGITVD